MAEGETCWKLVDVDESNEQGEVVIKDIPVLKSIQEYRLVELKAPPGFTRPQGQWKIKYDPIGKRFIPVEGTESDPNSASVGNPPAIEAVNAGETTTYKIRNYRPGQLPFSGNTGIRMFLLLGGGLDAPRRGGRLRMVCSQTAPDRETKTDRQTAVTDIQLKEIENRRK